MNDLHGDLDQAFKARIAGPDILKGILILLVIYGHTITPLPDKHLLKWVLYGFHMPAFFMLSGLMLSGLMLSGLMLSGLMLSGLMLSGLMLSGLMLSGLMLSGLMLSGLMLSSPRYLTLSFSQFLNRYKKLLIPWFIASLLWLVLFNFAQLAGGAKVALRAIAYLFLYPSFHLWFVPALFLMALATWAFGRGERGRMVLFIAALLLAVFHPLVPWTAPALGRLKFLMGDPRVYLFYIYFLFGYFYRNQFRPVSAFTFPLKKWSGLIFAASFSLFIYCFFHPPTPVLGLASVLMNLAVYVHFPALCLRLQETNHLSRFLGWVGRNSFYIYLAHPFVTVPVSRFKLYQQNELGYSFALWLAATALLYAMYAIAGRSRPITLREQSGVRG